MLVICHHDEGQIAARTAALPVDEAVGNYYCVALFITPAAGRRQFDENSSSCPASITYVRNEYVMRYSRRPSLDYDPSSYVIVWCIVMRTSRRAYKMYCETARYLEKFGI